MTIQSNTPRQNGKPLADLLYATRADSPYHTPLTYPHVGRDFRLTDVYGNVAGDIIA